MERWGARQVDNHNSSIKLQIKPKNQKTSKFNESKSDPKKSKQKQTVITWWPEQI